MDDAIFTVSALTRRLKETIEGGFPFVWVRGQVVNLSRPSSGHLYFSLRDEEASLNAVWFRHRQRACDAYDPLTGEVRDKNEPPLSQVLENGMEVLAAGGLTVYGARGSYQLAVEMLVEAGEGRLRREFEALKRKLAALGYFALERKRPLPYNPQRVALVTALGGAAIHDFLKIAATRGAGAAIRVFPSLVQGEKAPEAIAAALAQAQEGSWAQVIALVRGGGSSEDLAAFNDERVAHAVFCARMPVVAGIGHEIDVSLADMVADARAATPTHAAQLIWPSRQALMDGLTGAARSLRAAFATLVAEREQQLAQHRRILRTLSPQAQVGRQEERLAGQATALRAAITVFFDRAGQGQAQASRALARAVERRLEAAQAAFAPLAARLDGLDPWRPLERGYVLARLADGHFLRRVEQVQVGEKLDIFVADGRLVTRIEDVERERDDG